MFIYESRRPTLMVHSMAKYTASFKPYAFYRLCSFLVPESSLKDKPHITVWLNFILCYSLLIRLATIEFGILGLL